MNPSIFERVIKAAKVLNGTLQVEDRVGLIGEWDVKVVRADGTVETKTLRNVVTAAGMNRIANLALAGLTATSRAAYIVVGTATVAPQDTDVQSFVGECGSGRRIGINPNVQSREWMSITVTYAGFVDGLATIPLDSAAISDYASSSQATGIIFNRVNGLAVTLQNSDFLNLTARIRVGSHNQGHST